jgi:hypothetical protein
LVIFDLQTPATAFILLVATPLFAVSFASDTMELPHLLLFPSKNCHTPTPLLPYFHLS